MSKIQKSLLRSSSKLEVTLERELLLLKSDIERRVLGESPAAPLWYQTFRAYGPFEAERIVLERIFDAYATSIPELSEEIISVEIPSVVIELAISRGFFQTQEKRRLPRFLRGKITEWRAKMLDTTAGTSSFAQNIQRYRLECGWTQDQLAEKVSLSERQVRAHEKGRSSANPDTLKVYSQVFTKQLGKLIMVRDLSGDSSA